MAASYLMPVLVFLLASASVAGLAAAFAPRSAPDPLKARFERVSGAAQPDTKTILASDDGRERTRAIEKTLRELDEKSVARKGGRPTLTARLRQAGLPWTRKTYHLACAGAGMTFYAAAFLVGSGFLPSAGFGLAGGLLVPHLYVSARRKSRLKRFTAEFPNAVDVIVRGLKAGLPMADCLRVIAAEAQEPVRGEFLTVSQDQTLGMPIDEAVQRLRERVPLPEASFFAIVVAIQSRTGGSLSEALGNLSKVLRERRKMHGKIRAMSSEAKSSAGIIAALPFLVAGAVYMTSPDYMSLLFETPTGKIVLAGCALWMCTGILVMRKMINFDF